MNENQTYSAGRRVRVTGRTHHGVTGRVTAVSGSDYLPISVALDDGCRSAYDPSELEPIPGEEATMSEPPAGFVPSEDIDGSANVWNGPTVSTRAGLRVCAYWTAEEGLVFALDSDAEILSALELLAGLEEVQKFVRHLL